MINKNVFGKAGFSGHVERIGGIQSRGLSRVLDAGRMARMIENET